MVLSCISLVICETGSFPMLLLLLCVPAQCILRFAAQFEMKLFGVRLLLFFILWELISCRKDGRNAF